MNSMFKIMTSVLAVVVVALVAWASSRPPATPMTTAAVTDGPATPEGLPASSLEPIATSPASSSHSVATPAKNLFADENLNSAERLRGLSALADQGDVDARHFGFEMVADCETWQRTASAGASSLTVKEPAKVALMTQALNSLNTRCAGLSDLPEYQKIKNLVVNNPRDLFAQDTSFAIKNSFADAGANAALTTSLDALARRPDENTISAITETLSAVDLAQIFTEPLSSSSSSVNPARRVQNLSYALNLLACDDGRPCGPESTVVQSYCIGMGVCSPGSSLIDLYQNVMLSGEDMQDVNALVDALRKLKTPHR